MYLILELLFSARNNYCQYYEEIRNDTTFYLKNNLQTEFTNIVAQYTLNHKYLIEF